MARRRSRSRRVARRRPDHPPENSSFRDSRNRSFRGSPGAACRLVTRRNTGGRVTRRSRPETPRPLGPDRPRPCASPAARRLAVKSSLRGRRRPGCPGSAGHARDSEPRDDRGDPQAGSQGHRGMRALSGTPRTAGGIHFQKISFEDETATTTQPIRGGVRAMPRSSPRVCVPRILAAP